MRGRMIVSVKASATIKNVKRNAGIEDCMHNRYILVFRRWLIPSDEMNMIQCGIAPGNTLYLFMRR